MRPGLQIGVGAGGMCPDAVWIYGVRGGGVKRLAIRERPAGSGLTDAQEMMSSARGRLPSDSSRPQNPMRVKAILSKRIKLILPVQSHLQKEFHSGAAQITSKDAPSRPG